MDRPAIGICTAQVDATWGVWSKPAALLPYAYVDAIQAAGGMTLMLPPDPAFLEDPDQALSLIDGLILAGGNDLDPASYGAERHPATRLSARNVHVTHHHSTNGTTCLKRNRNRPSAPEPPGQRFAAGAGRGIPAKSAVIPTLLVCR